MDFCLDEDEGHDGRPRALAVKQEPLMKSEPGIKREPVVKVEPIIKTTPCKQKGGPFDPAESNTEHVQNCRAKGCFRCAALRMECVARETMPMLHESTCLNTDDIKDSRRMLANMPWFAVRIRPDGRCVFGCLACEAAGDKGNGGRWSYTSFQASEHSALRISSIKRHNDLEQHKHNALQFLEVDVGPSKVLTANAPPAEAFLKVLHHVRKGHSADEGVVGVACSKKVKQMTFCLAEAMRVLDRRLTAPM